MKHPIAHYFRTIALGILVAALALYLGDALALQLRIHRGTGYRTIEVNQFLATPLKGQKDEYDYIGTSPVTCVRSIFPQPNTPACWWLERHTAQWQ